MVNELYFTGKEIDGLGLNLKYYLEIINDFCGIFFQINSGNIAQKCTGAVQMDNKVRGDPIKLNPESL